MRLHSCIMNTINLEGGDLGICPLIMPANKYVYSYDKCTMCSTYIKGLSTPLTL